MASAEYMDMIEASPQMEDGNQPTVDDMEDINIGTTDDLVQYLLVNNFLKKINKNIINFFVQIEMCLLGLMKKCPD
jgi:hypothetical protein